MIDQEKIHKQCLSENPKERMNALNKLKFKFPLMPDKQQPWKDLIKLNNDKNSEVRSKAAETLRSVFSDVPDKQQAWNDLIILTNDKNISVKSEAAYVLGSVFSDVPDKQQAWNDLHKLTNDKYSSVRSSVTSALGSAFSDVPDKQLAWNDLHKLTNDKNIDVRSEAAYVLGSVYSDVPDKQQAWSDLIKLTNDENRFVRSNAAYVLGSVFLDVSDKQQVWNDLIKLTNDPRSLVRNDANHSLGKFSIFKASQAENEEEYERELKTAIVFFEKASQKSYEDWVNPAQFCLPFYRSFHTIVFKRQEAKEEVDKYLTEAKDAIKGSKSKELLVEAVENLSNALKEVQNLKNMDLETKKGELNFYRQYIDRAEELLRDTEETVPFAPIAMRKWNRKGSSRRYREETVPFAPITIRKGLPILDRNLKELLEEIQKKAKIACKESKGTATEDIACAVSKEVQKWEIGSQEEMTRKIDNIIFTLEESIPKNPENQRIFDRIRNIREQKYIVNQFDIISTIIPLIPKLQMEQGINNLKKSVGEVNEKTTIIIKNLEEIQKKLKNLDELADKIGGTEGENIKIFSEKLFEIAKKGDSETLKLFLEKVLKNEDILTREIENSSATQKEKEESKGSISKLKSLLKKVKNPAKEFGKDVANEIVVSYTAKGIIELFLPIMSMAVFGVPIPSQIIDILTNVITEIKNQGLP